MRPNRLSAITPRAAVFIASALLGAAILLAFQNDRMLKAEKIRQTSVQAEILAASIAAPLAFDDAIAVQEYLAALRKNPDIQAEIGRASCRERVCQYVEISVVAVALKNNIIDYI